MDEYRTWREFLGELISDSHERQRIADLIDVSPITLQRWANDKSMPRQDNLRLLLDSDVLSPQKRQQLLSLLQRDFPGFIDYSRIEAHEQSEIPATFYAQVLNTFTNSPVSMRENTLVTMIIQQIMHHLHGQQHGILVAIARCVTPADSHAVRSLMMSNGRATAPWDQDIERQTQFFGAESQTGHALISRHPIVIQARQEKQRLFPHHYLPAEESSAAYPILIADRTAGSLCIVSTQPQFFTQLRINLLQNYVDLLVLAFEPASFYDLTAVKLGIMPPRDQQQPYLQNFQRRVTRHIVHATKMGKSLTSREAELLVWQEIEEELLHSAPWQL